MLDGVAPAGRARPQLSVSTKRPSKSEYTWSETSPICESPTWGYRGTDEQKLRARYEKEKKEDDKFWAQRKAIEEREARKLQEKRAKEQQRQAKVDAKKREKDEQERKRKEKPDADRSSRRSDRSSRASSSASRSPGPSSIASFGQQTQQTIHAQLVPTSHFDRAAASSFPAIPSIGSPMVLSPYPDGPTGSLTPVSSPPGGLSPGTPGTLIPMLLRTVPTSVQSSNSRRRSAFWKSGKSDPQAVAPQDMLVYVMPCPQTDPGAAPASTIPLASVVSTSPGAVGAQASPFTPPSTFTSQEAQHPGAAVQTTPGSESPSASRDSYFPDLSALGVIPESPTSEDSFDSRRPASPSTAPTTPATSRPQTKDGHAAVSRPRFSRILGLGWPTGNTRVLTKDRPRSAVPAKLTEPSGEGSDS